MENIVGIITSVSATYYSILMTVTFALFGAFSYLSISFFEDVNLRKQKKIWIIGLIIILANIIAIYNGFSLFKLLQDITYECYSKCDDVKLKLSEQQCTLSIQLWAIVISSCFLGVFAYLTKKDKK